MYRILAGGDLIFDALSDSACVASASISQSVNAAAYLDMSVDPSGCPDIEEGVTAIEVLWDSETLFHGTVSETSLDVDGMLSVTAVSDVDALNRVLARPHSTDGSVGEECPDTLSGYFQWLVSQFNRTNVGGYRIDVGVNQGDLIRGTGIAVSEDGYPTVASLVDSEILSYGGYLDFTPFSGGGTIDLYADIHEASGQMVDFGRNVVDIGVTRSTEGQRTAVIPYCGDMTVSGASESDRRLIANSGLIASGDALYDPDAVARYGYREERYEVEGAESVADLVREGAARLRAVTAPTVTVECRAVDMALYMDGYDHLRVGQAVRVRSAPHGVDEYLAVQDMALDLMDPSQTTYTLGVAYDTLTGGQSARLRELNLGIDHSIDVATGAASAAQSAQDAAQSAHDAAQSAQDSADAAQGAAESAQSTADAASGQAQSAMTQATEAAQAAQEAAGRADELQQEMSDITATVNGVEQDVTELTSQVSGAVEKADQSLSVATEAKQTADSVSTTASRAYEDAQSALSQSSSALQTAQGLQTTVEEEYLSKDEASGSYASKSEVTQTRDDILSTVESEYQSKDGMSSYYTKTEVDQRDDAITSTVSTAQSTADSALSKASTVEQTANGLEVRLTQAEGDVEAAQGAAEDAASAASAAGASATTALDRATYQFGTCSTAAGTRAKVVSLPGFARFTGATVQVRFAYANTASSPTLNVNSTGAATIRAYGASLAASSAYNWVANAVVTFVFDGTYWNVADGASLSKASAARDAADDAAKTATNYLGFDSSGLVVGDQTGTSLGKNVLIDSDSVDIRDGSTVLARFGANLIELGRNSADSTVEMCGGEVRLSYISGSGLLLNSGLYSDGYVRGDGLVSAGLLNATGPLYLGDGKRNGLRGFYTGTVVVTISGGTAVLFTAAQYQSLVGRAYKAGDVVVCANGDRDANGLGPVASYQPSSGAWHVNVPGSASDASSYRVNYLIVAIA